VCSSDLFAVNPVLDTAVDGLLSDNNESIIAISCFDNEFVQQQADLVLPLAAVIESSGSFVNIEGLWQSFKGCVQSRGDSRQGWKILSALGQVLHPGEFDYADSVAVRSELKTLCSDVALSNLCGIKSNDKTLPKATGQVEKIGFTPIYASDDMTRLSAALQATPLMRMQSSVTMNREMAGLSKLLDSDQVQIKQGKGTAVLPLCLDEGVPDGCVYIPGGIEAVRYLADAFGKISLEKVS
jgi:NADH-quinone oxidoreductase subunit G